MKVAFLALLENGSSGLHSRKLKSGILFSRFCFFTDGKQHKVRELDMITLRNHAPRSYMTWLTVTLSDLDMIIVNLQLDDVTGANMENSLYAFGQSEKI